MPDDLKTLAPQRAIPVCAIEASDARYRDGPGACRRKSRSRGRAAYHFHARAHSVISHEYLARREQRTVRFTDADQLARLVANEYVLCRRTGRERHDAAGAEIGRVAQIENDRRKRYDVLRWNERITRAIGNLFNRAALVQQERSGAFAHERAHVRGNADSLTEIFYQRTHVRAFAASHAKPRGSILHPKQRQAINRNRARSAFDMLAFAR